MAAEVPDLVQRANLQRSRLCRGNVESRSVLQLDGRDLAHAADEALFHDDRRGEGVLRIEPQRARARLSQNAVARNNAGHR